MNEPLRRWLEFFYQADKKSEANMKELLHDAEPPIRQAYEKYLNFTKDEELRQLEDARQAYLHDFNTAIESAELKGIEKERMESLLRILTKRFDRVPYSVVEKLRTINDLDRLAELTDLSLDCATLEQFEAALE